MLFVASVVVAAYTTSSDANVGLAKLDLSKAPKNLMVQPTATYAPKGTVKADEPATHYSNPFSGGCKSDEIVTFITGYKGEICSPHCDASNCPTDMPPGTSGVPECALSSSTGKFCILACNTDDQCDSANGGSCQQGAGGGICTYGAAPSPPPATHYSDPATGCLPDEQTFQITGVTGNICSPPCTASQTCPTDKPVGVTGIAACALNGPSGKYCVIECSPTGDDAQCGTNASCKSPQAGFGICTYDA